MIAAARLLQAGYHLTPSSTYSIKNVHTSIGQVQLSLVLICIWFDDESGMQKVIWCYLCAAISCQL